MFVPPICCSALSRLSLSLLIPCACLSTRYPLIAIGTPRRTSSHYSFTGKAILGIASSSARPSAKYIVHPLFKRSDHQLWVTRSKQMTSRPSVYKVDLSTTPSNPHRRSVLLLLIHRHLFCSPPRALPLCQNIRGRSLLFFSIEQNDLQSSKRRVVLEAKSSQWNKKNNNNNHVKVVVPIVKAKN